jgi:hypothetical protein
MTSIWGLHTKLWASKVVRVPMSKISRLQLGSLETKWHLNVGPVARHIEHYKGEGGGFPQVRAMVSCESMFARGFFMHQKCSNYALTNLLFVLCKCVWIIDLLIICLSPHPRAPIHPSTPEMLWAKERTPTPYPFVVFTFGFRVESIRELRGASTVMGGMGLRPKVPLTIWGFGHASIMPIIKHARCMEHVPEFQATKIFYCQPST